MAKILKDKDWVYIHNLTGALQLNGKLGQVGQFHQDKDRYEVFVPDLEENKFTGDNIAKLFNDAESRFDKPTLKIDHESLARLFRDLDNRSHVKLIKRENLKCYEKKEQLVKCVLVHPTGGYGGGYGETEEVWYPKEHPMFRCTHSRGNSPLAEHCGFPLFICQYPCDRNKHSREKYDNQFATYMKISLESGLAGAQWQSYVGHVIVFRPQTNNEELLSPKHLGSVDCDILWDFSNMIIDISGDMYDDMEKTQRRIRKASSPEAFVKYVVNYGLRCPGGFELNNILQR